MRKALFSLRHEDTLNLHDVAGLSLLDVGLGKHKFEVSWNVSLA